MSDPPLHYRSILSLARDLRRRELSPVELTEHFLARIEAFDGKLDAFRLVCPERALDQARAATARFRSGGDLGSLDGIPFAVKDLFDVGGLPTTAGSRLLADNIASADARVVDRLTRAGMVLLGKTNTVQFAYGGVGVNHDHGTPHNPWHAEHHVPGGSSSGSAVAVAAGMTPVALGTDTGGSVRIPAALCGTTGLKTTVGQVSRAGVYPLSFSLDSVGPLARAAEDAALVYECIQGPDPADDATFGRPRQDARRGLGEGIRGMRLAFAETTFWEEVDPEVEAAVRACGPVLEEQGASVGRIEFAEARAAQEINPRGLVIAAEAYTVNRLYIDGHFDALDPVVASRMVNGREVAAYEYLETVRAWSGLRARAADTLREVDAILCPTTMIPARPLALVDGGLETYTRFNLQYLRNAAIGNILGLCGLSVPCGTTAEGLPIGLMIYGKSFDEPTVLRVGHAFQQATEWHLAVPAMTSAD